MEIQETFLVHLTGEDVADMPTPADVGLKAEIELPILGVNAQITYAFSTREDAVKFIEVVKAKRKPTLEEALELNKQMAEFIRATFTKADDSHIYFLFREDTNVADETTPYIRSLLA